MRFSNTNLNLYKGFIALYETGSTNKACEMLGISTQSTVSSNISALEKQLNVKLFKAHPRGMTPTSDAIELYNKIKQSFDTIFFTEKDFGEFNENSSSTIRIACTTNFTGYYLAKYIVQHSKVYKNTQFEVFKTRIDEAITMLKKHEVDFIIGLPLIDNEFDVLPLGEFASIFFASASFAFQHNITSVITRECFQKLPFIAIRKFAEYKNAIVTVDSFDMTFQMVRNDLGIGCCFRKYLDINHKEESIVQFNVEGITLPLYPLNCFYYKKFLRKAALAFIKKLSSESVYISE